MRVAITGGTGFVGRHVAARLAAGGHEVVIVARGVDARDRRVDQLDRRERTTGARTTGPQTVAELPGVTVAEASVLDRPALERAFAGCLAVIHCAGINRELGDQTYERVHIQGTHAVVQAARAMGVQRLAMLSFLRARPACGSGYHDSKWRAEEIVRGSGLDWTVIKAGVIYGRGDHMLDHLSRAFHTLPVFGLVGVRDRSMRPVAVEDVARVLAEVALRDDRLIHRTVAVLGPEEMTLREAVGRVARIVGRRPILIPLPVVTHRLLASVLERVMVVPLVSAAQVRILAEGIVDPLPAAENLPDDLLPTTPFDEISIRAGLPPRGGFGWRDFRLASSTSRRY
jgi:uncharacterized protein YbjT (DUF2867 family)